MITYKYTAMSKDGAKVSGVVNAIDEYSAVDRIKAKYPVVIKVEEVKDSVETTPSFTEADAEVLGTRDNTITFQQALNITEHNGNENLTDGKMVKENRMPHK